MRIAAVCDGLLAGQAQPARGRPIGPSLDDGLLATWPGPFGWLLLAEPAGRADLEELIQATVASRWALSRNTTTRRHSCGRAV